MLLLFSISIVNHVEDILENHKFSNTCHRVKKVLISSIGKVALRASVAATVRRNSNAVIKNVHVN